MPLSEHEQRLLEQIEQALYAEDPKFASAVRSTDLRRHYRRRLLRAAVLLLAGLGMVAGGVIQKIFPLAVAGAAVALAAVVLGVTFTHRMLTRGTQPRRSKSPRPKTSVVARLEERWLRRWEQRGRLP